MVQVIEAIDIHASEHVENAPSKFVHKNLILNLLPFFKNIKSFIRFQV